jgi:hypothetical protein
MSGRIVSDIQTRVEGERLYQLKIYVNQHESVSDIQTPSRS